jgi:hypothetical protein
MEPGVFFFEKALPGSVRKGNNSAGTAILLAGQFPDAGLNRRAGCPYVSRVEMEMGGRVMGPKFVFMALTIAFGLAVALATATTIRQVHTATSSVAHPIART